MACKILKGSKKLLKQMHRTELADFIMDLLDFVESKLAEARDCPSSREAAITEARGAAPLLRERLWTEDEARATQCVLVFRGLFDRSSEDWWTKLSELAPQEFPSEVDDAIRRITVAKSLFGNKD